MKFNRQLFKEAFKAGYKRAKQTLKESKSKSIKTENFPIIFDNLYRGRRRLDMRAEYAPSGKRPKYVDVFPTSPWDIVLQSPTNDELRKVFCIDDVESMEWSDKGNFVEQVFMVLKDGSTVKMGVVDVSAYD